MERAVAAESLLADMSVVVLWLIFSLWSFERTGACKAPFVL